MNKKNQKGVTGIDIAIALLIITIFTSIIASLFYNLNLTSKKIERQTEATYYAINIIEEIENEGYETYKDRSIENNPMIYENEPIIENGEQTGYYKTIKVIDYTDIEGNEEKNKDIIKKVTVTISFNIKGTEEKVELSTILEKDT